MRSGALKVLNFLFGSNGQEESFLVACSDRFVEVLGLKGIFPVFMVPKSVVSAKRKNEEEIDKIEEYSLLIILNLLKYSKKSNKQRCLYKFAENNFEKIERLVELYFKYSDKMIKCERHISKEKARLMAEDEEIDEEEFFSQRLSSGLITLQLIAQLIVLICSPDAHKLIEEVGIDLKDDIKSKLIKQINMRSSSIDHNKYIKRFVQEVIDTEEDEKQKENLQSLLDSF